MNKKGSVFSILVIVLIVIGIIATVVVSVSMYTGTYVIEGKVKDVQIVPTGDKDNPTTYVIWLEGGQKLEILRNFMIGDNEDDTYQLVHSNVNATMRFTCWGWQFDNRLLNIYWYPNVAHAEVIS